ncbi:MAG TPA: hypothetical protein ACQGQX_00175, partial [Xylella taiwanensis]
MADGVRYTLLNDNFAVPIAWRVGKRIAYASTTSQMERAASATFYKHAKARRFNKRTGTHEFCFM